MICKSMGVYSNLQYDKTSPIQGLDKYLEISITLSTTNLHGPSVYIVDVVGFESH